MNEPLDRFIREALGKGLGRDEIAQTLAAAKWPLPRRSERGCRVVPTTR